MGADVLHIGSQVAGIAGFTVAVFVLLLRDIIRRNIFPKLPPAQAYRLLSLITLTAWSVAIVGMLIWFYTNQPSASVQAGNCGVAIGGSVVGNSSIENNCDLR